MTALHSLVVLKFHSDFSSQSEKRPRIANKMINNHLSSKMTKVVTVKTAENNNCMDVPSADFASVFLRLRSKIEAPYEIKNNIFKMWNSKTNSKDYTFTDIFSSGVLQSEVYSVCVEKKIENEENFTVLTYGTSDSGKTYTLIGNSEQPGVIHRAIEHIFCRYKDNISTSPALKINKGEWCILNDDEIEAELQKRQQYFGRPKNLSSSSDQKSILSEHHFVNISTPNTTVYIWLSLIEIYNENIHDLLELPTTNVNRKGKSLKVMLNGGKSFISDLTSVLVTSIDEAYFLFNMAIETRQNGSTSINDKSSRSHCILVIDFIRQEHRHQLVVSHASYKFCDLAGSERLKKSEAKGVRCQEAQNINTSLFVLGRCLGSIQKNKRMKICEKIPYRDSKLTLVLQSALTGQEKLSFIVNMQPTAEYHEENKNVLKYASMVEEIVYQKSVNQIVGRRSTYSNFLAKVSSSGSSSGFENVSQLILDENNRLKKKISLLEGELTELTDFDALICQKNEEIEKPTYKVLKLEAEKVEHDDYITIQRDEANEIRRLQKKILKLEDELVNRGHEKSFEIRSLNEKIAAIEAECCEENDPIYADDPNLYKVVKILNCRTRNKNTNEYLVNWAPSWIAEKDVTRDLIEEFEKNNKAEGDSFSMF